MKRTSPTKKILVTPYNETREYIAKTIRKAITDLYNNTDVHIDAHDLEIPPQEIEGDFAFPCFSLAKELKKSPTAIAHELAEHLQKKNTSRVEHILAAGPYLNIVLSTRTVLENILSHIPTETSHILKRRQKKERVLIEYVSPNTNKPLHLGHIRNAVLGDAITRLLKADGHPVIQTCLVNDRGIHICKSMVAYLKRGGVNTPKTVNMKGDHFVGEYYVLFENMLKEHPELMKETQECLKKWEEGDTKTRALWKKMNAWVLPGMKATLKRFDIRFDTFYFESAIAEKGRNIILEQLRRGTVHKDETGAIIAHLERYGLPNKVLLRQDGTTLYITQDIYLAIEKWKNFKAPISLYVIGSEQDLYLKQLFAILDLFGYPWARQCFHVSYGMVNLPQGKMKSREGTVIDADNLLDEIEALVKDEIKKREKHISKKELLHKSRIIALAAIKFYMLEVNPKAEMIFNPKESISFQGKTGPYIQYTYARLRSILRKAHTQKTLTLPKGYDWKDEKKLILLLGQFSNGIVESAQHYSPSFLAQYLYSLAKTATELYHELPVLTAPAPQRQARLFLFQQTSRVLKMGLSLLGIDVLESM